MRVVAVITPALDSLLSVPDKNTGAVLQSLLYLFFSFLLLFFTSTDIFIWSFLFLTHCVYKHWERMQLITFTAVMQLQTYS